MAINEQAKKEKVVLEFDSEFMTDLKVLIPYMKDQDGAEINIERFLELQVTQLVAMIQEVIHNKENGKWRLTMTALPSSGC